MLVTIVSLFKKKTGNRRGDIPAKTPKLQADPGTTPQRCLAAYAQTPRELGAQRLGPKPQLKLP